jgi:acyl carrier protein
MNSRRCCHDVVVSSLHFLHGQADKLIDAVSSNLALARRRDGSWRVEMQALDTDIRSRILALVIAILNSIAVDVLPDSLLADVELTSMDMVNLMLGVESELDLTIPQSEITPDNKGSLILRSTWLPAMKTAVTPIKPLL